MQHSSGTVLWDCQQLPTYHTGVVIIYLSRRFCVETAEEKMCRNTGSFGRVINDLDSPGREENDSEYEDDDLPPLENNDDIPPLETYSNDTPSTSNEMAENLHLVLDWERMPIRNDRLYYSSVDNGQDTGQSLTTAAQLVHEFSHIPMNCYSGCYQNTTQTDSNSEEGDHIGEYQWGWFCCCFSVCCIQNVS